jgi:hypothetical protein
VFRLSRTYTKVLTPERAEAALGAARQSQYQLRICQAYSQHNSLALMAAVTEGVSIYSAYAKHKQTLGGGNNRGPAIVWVRNRSCICSVCALKGIFLPYARHMLTMVMAEARGVRGIGDSRIVKVGTYEAHAGHMLSVQ